MRHPLLCGVLALGAWNPLAAQTPISLDSTTRFALRNGRVVVTEYHGRAAIRLAPLPGQESGTDQEVVAVLTDTDFQDGVIEVDVAGFRRPGYATDNVSAFKGFIGISFRVQGERAERLYLRPENSPLDDQVFRNRSTQYESDPEYPWQRLRREAPGVYESYADIEPGAWTRLRIEVEGTRARLYVNGAAQPCLVVDDLKNGVSRGQIALWTRISSEAYFSNLRVTRAGDRRAAIEPAAARFTHVSNGRAEVTRYQGRPAVRLIPSPETAGRDEGVLALVAGEPFRDGVIEVEVAGAPRAGAPPDSRGFIGIAFRAGARGEWSELFYLRPTNGRAESQLRRNRSVQYVSHPEYTWSRLREEAPGKYEAYADLEPGVWTRLRIEVAGTEARLYVNGAAHPSLVVTDLKHGAGAGQIGLWAHVETEGYFGTITTSRH